MKNKTILGCWCTEQNCMFIDSKHIQIELVAHIWYSYDNDSKTDVINKKLCFVKEIDFNELNNEVEILEEEKKIPEKLDLILDEQFTNDELQAYIYETQVKINQILDYLKSKGDE